MSTTPPQTPCCPKCGFDIPPPPHLPPAAASSNSEDHDDGDDAHAALQAANRKIADLETQIRLLNQKAAAAIDRWADYEDELARLRRSYQQQQSPSPAPRAHTPPQHRTSFLPAGAAHRLSALLSPRSSVAVPPKTTRTPPPPPPPQQQQQQQQSPPPTPATGELLTALAREQALRRQAEGRLNQTSREVEELSASLFEQANEMVATERRARAALEERVAMLERRDVEKRGRLERLERAVGRIESVKRLLDRTAPVVAKKEEEKEKEKEKERGGGEGEDEVEMEVDDDSDTGGGRIAGRGGREKDDGDVFRE